ncbi:hypothetical protein SISNIDRAFT_448003 [Sistotremastrum niveocremeum HHB9708]|uniref:Cyclin N-terminal domain-containing protein n=1 Tax=Sistotremastrum niveocremeum HHB9708 TaxID=1314777 RepID=A0A165AK94_9AGAM|nr:hypothetical protein SISNIDRAFT_448003 [Sistotremastrum niveocremeum HHB9708]
MATAQVLFQRFWYVSSMKQFGINDIGMGALYLASKLEECPLRMRDLINVYDLLLTKFNGTSSEEIYKPMGYFATKFYDYKEALVIAEMQILKRLGFNVQVVLPYGTLVNYLRVLELTSNTEACQKAWGYLNDALQTPCYAIYSIPTVVTAAILLATRHLAIPLPKKWHEIFDATWDDMWAVAQTIMRLYNKRVKDQMALLRPMLGRHGVRRWLQENTNADTTSPLTTPREKS